MAAVELFRQHLSNIGNPTISSIYSPDVVMEFPYAPQHHTQRLEGRDAVIKFLTNIGVYFADYQVGESIVYSTSDANVIIGEYPATAVYKENGKSYKQKYIAVISLNGNQIAHIREYYNPINVLVATDEIEQPGSSQ